MLRFIFKAMHPVDPNQNYGKKIPFFLLLVFFLLVSSFTSISGAQVIDSLLFELETETSSEKKAELMLCISRQYYHTDLREAIRFARQANELFMQNQDRAGIRESLNLLGAGNFQLGEYLTAETYFLEALSLSGTYGDSLLLGKLLNNLAGIKLNTGKLVEAIDYYEEAGAIFKAMNNPQGTIGIEISISSIYRSIGSYRKAHDHLQSAFQLADEETDKQLLGTIYHNLGTLLIDEDRFREALEVSLKAWELRTQTGQLSGQIKTLISLGSIYDAKGEKHASDTCYQRAYRLAEKFGYTEDEAYCLMHLGYLQLENENYREARDYLLRSLSLADWLKDPELQIQVHDYLFYVDSVQGNFGEALAHLQQYNNLKSEFEEDATATRLEQLENLFSLARDENQLKENIIQRNRSLIIFLLSGLAILVLITVLIIQQIILRSQKKVAELTQENLRSQMNPHFIFNILNSIHAFLLKNDTQASGNYLMKFSNLLRLTLDNSRSKLASIHDELDALKLYLELESMRFNDQLEYKIIIDEEIDPLMFKIPTFLLQPYVENSIVHGLQNKEGKGKIEIRLEYQHKGIHCSITDNGIGRNKAEDLKLQKGIKHTSHGSKITETRLKLLNSLYGRKFSVMYTDLLDEHENCRGTKVEFNLPVLN